MTVRPNAEQVRSAVQKVCKHTLFKRSPKMCAFLTYITEEALNDRANGISAYSVAVDALQKPDDFDPQQDPSIRVMAKRLRDTLELYYEHSPECLVRIALTPGSYAPSFEFAQTNRCCMEQWSNQQATHEQAEADS